MNPATNPIVSCIAAKRSHRWRCFMGGIAAAYLLSSALAAEVDLTPIQGGDGAYTQVTVGGQQAWQNSGTSRYLYGRRPNSFAFTSGQTLYVRVTYFDDASGTVDLQFDAQTSTSKTSTLTTRTSRVNSGRFVDGYFELSDVRFNKSLNGSDFRIVCGTAPGAMVPVQRITLSDTPFDNPDFQLAVSRAWQTRFTGPAKDYVDPTTLKGKVMTGYQGWFGTPNDIADTDRWKHWAGGSMISENFQIDAWPDLTEYDPASLIRAADVLTESGAPAYLFSSRSYAAVQKHFRWMRKHNIDGAWLQRFNPKAGAESEWVLRNVSQAAAEEGLIWGVEYDVSGMADSTVAAKLQADWEWLTTQFDILNDPRYVRENGQPVVFIWGLAVPDRAFTTASANAAVDYFKAQGAYVIGGLPTNWASLNADWQAHMAKYDGVLVWQNTTPSDAALFRNRGQDFFPHIWPGFSWAHLKQLPATPLTQYTARSGGQFLWNKGRDWINASAGADRLFIGMFDEYDEATHVMPMTDDHPNAHTEWGRFIDNEGKPSDWWMMLTDELKRMMNGQRANTSTLPTVASLSNRSNIGAEASVDLGTTDIASSLSRVNSTGDGSTVVETVGGKECRGNASPTTTHRYMYFNVNNTFASQLVNGDVTIEVEYYDSAGSTVLGLEYDSNSAAYTNHPQPITTTGSNTWRRVRFEIANAFFGGRQNGSSDFRLTFSGKKLNVNRVWVRLPEGKAYPFTWTNATTGPSLTWSQNANWLGGIVAQSDSTSIVRFFPEETMPGGAISIQNDLSGQQFGALKLGGTAASSASTTVTLSGNAFSLGGNEPTITLDAIRTAHDLTYDIASPITLLSATQVSGPGNASLRISGALSGTGGLTKTTSGALTLSGSNTYSGSTAITSGVLTLGANNALPPTALTLGSATLNAATFTDTVGTLSLTGNATINLGAGASLTFSDSSTMDWTSGNLTLTGTFVSGSSLRFGTSNTSLTPTQLSRISGVGFNSFGLTSSGFLTAVTTPTFTITNTTTDVNGTSTPTGALLVNSGGNQTYTFTPNPGFSLATLTVNGLPVPPALSFTFTNVTSNQTISATFVNIATTPLYWDSDGSTAGFGGTTGTWGISQFWSLNSSGSSASIPATTTTDSSVNFGTATLNHSNANVTVAAGGVSAGNITFGAGQSTALTLSGGNITLGPTALITVNNTTNTIASVLTGASTSLTKAGNGNLILSGANTYSGTTTISAGTLQVGNGTDVGSIASSNGIVNNAALVYNVSSGNRTYGNIISGNGSLTQASVGGTLILSGNNTYTGATTISAGTLQIGNGTDVGSIASTSAINNNGSLIYNVGAGSRTLAAGISGNGSLTQASAGGTLILSANNTYTGGTTIAAGTLAISGGNNTLLDTGAVNLSSNASTFNLSGLTTGETIGSLSGVAGSILNLGGKALTVGDANSTTFAGNITTSTGATLIKNGAGNLTLSGFNAYRTTTINAGTLEIAGGGTTASTASWTGSGRLTVTGGILTATTQNFNLPGTMNIVGGTITGQNNRFNAAATNQTGGNVSILGASSTGSWIGYGAGRNTTYTVSGAATLSVNGDSGSGAYLSIGRENSNAAQTAALVLQTGGTVNIGTTSHGNLYIGQFSGSNAANGKLDVQGGTLTVGTFDSNNTLGFFFGGSTGSLKAEMTQSGGTVTTRGILFGAGGGTYVNTATANLTLSGGVLYIGTGGITASSGFTNGGTAANITLLGGTLGASGDWTSSMAMKLGNATIQASNSSGTARGITLTGVLSNATGAGTLTKTGDGTLTLSGNNTYTGATVINGGTLALGASNTLPATSVTIGNATLNSATFSDSLGTLNVTGTAAINLGAGANLSFAASNSIPWPGTLNLTGTFISGSSLRFGTAPGGLTSIQLGKISATGFTGFALNSSGYLTALPAGFPAWIAGTFANGQVPPDKRGANHDPDNDGIPNLIEYAIAGHDPTMANPSIGTFTGTSLSYTKRPGTTGLAYAIQESTDLGLADTWAELPPSGSYQNDTGTISFTFTLGVPAKNFLRLQVVSN